MLRDEHALNEMLDELMVLVCILLKKPAPLPKERELAQELFRRHFIEGDLGTVEKQQAFVADFMKQRDEKARRAIEMMGFDDEE